MPWSSYEFLFKQRPYSGLARLVVQVSKLHSDTPHSVGFFWTSDQSVAETTDNKQHSQQTDMHVPGGIGTRIPSK